MPPPIRHARHRNTEDQQRALLVFGCLAALSGLMVGSAMALLVYVVSRTVA